jgi:hypothetical protein
MHHILANRAARIHVAGHWKQLCDHLQAVHDAEWVGSNNSKCVSSTLT